MVTSARPTLNDSVIQNATLRAVQNVCRVMIKQDAKFVEPAQPGTFCGEGNSFEVLGSVGFTGDATGVVHLCLSNDFASHAVHQVIGAVEMAASAHDFIKDVIGELTNITAGGFKNALCDLGYPCRLTLPTIARGDKLRVATIKDTQRHIFHFDCGGHTLVADIQFRIG